MTRLRLGWLREYVNGQQERFLTTQHERDVETGLDYRGARFYDSEVARFLSLDPAASEYPSLSDYCYVAGNPIFFTDPDGKNPFRILRALRTTYKAYKKTGKLNIKTLKQAGVDEVESIASNLKTIFDGTATWVDAGYATVELLTGLDKKDVKVAKGVLNRISSIFDKKVNLDKRAKELHFNDEMHFMKKINTNTALTEGVDKNGKVTIYVSSSDGAVHPSVIKRLKGNEVVVKDKRTKSGKSTEHHGEQKGIRYVKEQGGKPTRVDSAHDVCEGCQKYAKENNVIVTTPYKRKKKN